MKRVVAGMLLLAFAVAAQAADPAPRIVLTLTDEAAEPAREAGALPAALQALDAGELSLVPVFHLPADADKLAIFREIGMHRYFRVVAPGAEPEELFNRISENDGVLAKELSRPHEALITPNDYTIHNMWGLDQIECPSAWDIHHGDSEVVVTTIDTGCDIFHEDLADNIYVNPGEDLNGNGVWDDSDNNGIDDDGNGFVDDLTGWDFVSHTETDDPADGEDYAPRDNEVYPDVHGHGTHVMGSAAAVTDNSTGVAAASWNVKAMPLRAGYAVETFFGLAGVGWSEDFADAVNYGVNNGSRVISISFGGATYNQFYQDAITYARANNVLVFAAAGNNDSQNFVYPAAYDGALAVAATGPGDVKADFSSYGTWVALSAPGVDIWSTMSYNNYHPYDYAEWDGTSMASPTAASVAGLLLNFDPALTDDELETAILNTCDNIDDINPGYAGMLGEGRINAYEALAEVGFNDQWPPPSDLSASLDEQTGEVTLTWNAPAATMGAGGPAGATPGGELRAHGSEIDRAMLTGEKDELAAQFRRQRRQAHREAAGEHDQPALSSADPDEPPELDEFLNYAVYRDGEMIAEPTEETYVDQLPDFGDYDYTVTAVYTDGESLPTASAHVNWIDYEAYALLEDFNAGLPETWSIESTVATATWHIDWGGEWAHFPTPYMLVDSDAPGSGPHLMERLITPAMDLSDRDFVELEYSHVFDEYIDEYGYVEYSLSGGAWNTIATYSSPNIGPETVSHVLTDDLAGESDVRVSFYYDDLDNWGWYWGVDDVTVYATGGEEPATLTATPIVDTVPAEGGAISYSVTLVNNTGNAYQNVTYWTMAILPDGSEYGPTFQVMFTLQPFQTIDVAQMNQTVPAGAPAGEYTFVCNAGYYPNPALTDQFTFTKEGAAAGANDLSEWTASGWEIAGAAGDPAQVALPGEYSLGDAYPNPFNPETSVAVSLPEANELTVSVYNLAGRKVATLADGSYNAGEHRFAFDASGMASGVYFIRATVPGRLDEVRKVMLVR
ncbi:MAG: Thermophilic serine proteinase [Calditrichaeota bacterium]|nr:Thermophilic serine proteinase [Calditrichota bacterium]